MKRNKILLTLGSLVTTLPLLAPVLSSCGCTTKDTQSQFVLIKTSSGYCIDGLTNQNRESITEIVVPETIDGLPVVEISKGAFKGCINLKKITLPFIGHTKTAGGQGGFFGYVFGDEMYEGCGAYTWQEYSVSDEYDANPEDFGSFAIPSSLREVTITSATKIQPGAFSNCKLLSSITFTDTNNIKEIGNYAFSGCMALKNFTIPSKVEVIGRKAFQRCYKLKSIQVPNTCTTIKHNAFSNCILATSATIPQSVVEMGKLVFENFISGLIMVEAESVPTWNPEWVTNTVSVVYGYSNGGIYYTNDVQVAICGKDSNKYAFLISWLGKWENETVNIPGSVTCGGSTYPLKKIGPNVFSENEYVKTLNIGENVEQIGANAFEKCINLRTINFPSTLKEIGAEAFIGCNKLCCHTDSTSNSEVEGLFFNKVESIGTKAFYNLQGLTKVDFGTNMAYIYESAFENCEWLTPNRTKDEEGQIVKNPLIIPASVRYIGKNAFKNIAKQSAMTDSTIFCDLIFETNNDITIDESAFESIGLKSLTGEYKDYKTYKAFDINFNKINIQMYDSEGKVIKGFANSVFKDSYLYYINNFPDQIELVGAHALRAVKPRYIDGIDKDHRTWTLPATLKEIKPYAFYENNYCKFAFSDVSDSANLEAIGSYAFYNCSFTASQVDGGGFENLVIPDSVKTIGSYAFAYCTQLRTIHISTNSELTRLEPATFHHCEWLGDNSTLSDPVIVPANITYLGSSCFSYNYKLKFMTIKGKITTVGSSCFAFDAALDGGTSIDNAPLKFTESLNDCTSFGSAVYQKCTNLSWMPYPQSVITTIGSNSFEGCIKMSSFFIPECITTIGADAYKDCTGMTSVTGMSGVTNIGANAFNGCSNITSFTMNPSCATIQTNAFKDCKNLGKDDNNKFILPANIIQQYTSTSTKGMGDTPFAGWGNDQTIYFRKSNIVDYVEGATELTTRWGWTLEKTGEGTYKCTSSGGSAVFKVYIE